MQIVGGGNEEHRSFLAGEMPLLLLLYPGSLVQHLGWIPSKNTLRLSHPNERLNSALYFFTPGRNQNIHVSRCVRVRWVHDMEAAQQYEVAILFVGCVFTARACALCVSPGKNSDAPWNSVPRQASALRFTFSTLSRDIYSRHC